VTGLDAGRVHNVATAGAAGRRGHDRDPGRFGSPTLCTGGLR